jgi:integrase
VFGQTVNGQPWRSSNFIRRVYDPVIVLSGVQRRPMAATRSTATTIMSEAGVPIEHIARRLGHADIRTTRKYYLGPSERADRRAADAQAQYIRGAPEETPKTD